MTQFETEEGGISATVRKAIVLIICAPSLIILAGAIAGYTVGAAQDGALSLTDVGIIAGLCALIALLGFACVKTWPRGSDEIVAESTRKSTRLLYIAFAIGAITGIAFVAGAGIQSEALFSNAPINSALAIASIAVWVVVVPVLSWVWWRTIDEHEATAYTDGAMVAAHAYIVFAPAWWIASRAGWVPAQDPMIMLLIVSFIWSAVWLYRRYF